MAGWPWFRRSLARTTLLGVSSLAVLLWGAVTQLGLSMNSLIAQLLLLLGALVLVLVLAAACAMLLAFVRRKR